MAEKTRAEAGRLAELLNNMSLKAEATDDGSIDVHAEVLDGTRRCMSHRFVLSPAELGDDHKRLATLGVVVGADVMSVMLTALRVEPRADALDLLLKRAGDLKREAEDN